MNQNVIKRNELLARKVISETDGLTDDSPES